MEPVAAADEETTPAQKQGIKLPLLAGLSAVAVAVAVAGGVWAVIGLLVVAGALFALYEEAAERWRRSGGWEDVRPWLLFAALAAACWVAFYALGAHWVNAAVWSVLAAAVLAIFGQLVLFAGDEATSAWRGRQAGWPKRGARAIAKAARAVALYPFMAALGLAVQVVGILALAAYVAAATGFGLLVGSLFGWADIGSMFFGLVFTTIAVLYIAAAFFSED